MIDKKSLAKDISKIYLSKDVEFYTTKINNKDVSDIISDLNSLAKSLDKASKEPVLKLISDLSTVYLSEKEKEIPLSPVQSTGDKISILENIKNLKNK